MNLSRKKLVKDVRDFALKMKNSFANENHVVEDKTLLEFCAENGRFLIEFIENCTIIVYTNECKFIFAF